MLNHRISSSFYISLVLLFFFCHLTVVSSAAAASKCCEGWEYDSSHDMCYINMATVKFSERATLCSTDLIGVYSKEFKKCFRLPSS